MKYSYKKIILTSFALVIALSAAVTVKNIGAQSGSLSVPSQRLVGYGWSETIGWISFNDGSQPVTLDSTGNLSGYAWSENIGWVKFGGLSGFPDSSKGTDAKLVGDNLTGWARAVGGATAAEFKKIASTAGSGGTAGSAGEKWLAFSAQGYSDSYIYLTRLPATKHTVNGSTFYSFDTDKIYTGGLAKFKADPAAAISSAPEIPVGYDADRKHRLIFNEAQLASEPVERQTGYINNFKSSVYSRFLCASNTVGSAECHRNNQALWLPGVGYGPESDIYVSYHDSPSSVQYGAAEIIGKYTVGASGATASVSSSLSISTKDNRGGWDGWINLEGVSLTGPVTGTPPKKAFVGYAWGSDVIGWVDFSKVGVTSNLNQCIGPYGTVIADGQSFTYYSAQADDGSCQSEDRVCANGVLSGSYSAISCGDEDAKTKKELLCSRAGKVLKNGEKIEMYSKNSVRAGLKCAPFKDTLTCVDGKFIGTNGTEDSEHMYTGCRPLPAYKEY